MSRAPRPSWTHLPASDDPPPTVLDGLCRKFPQISRATWMQRFERGLIVDAAERPLALEAPYAAHLKVGYFREVEEEPEPRGELHIVYRDEHLIVVDKPPFVPVVPGGRWVRRCVLYRLESELGVEGLAPIHRLDRDTSGLVLFACRAGERGAYAGLFARGEVERVYEAYANVDSPPTWSETRVESRIVEGAPFFLMREIEGEPNAITNVEAAEMRGDVGRFILRPESGKKHQLRLHMARLGFPILGDRFYPEPLPEGPDDFDRPLRLKAIRLAFRDPITGDLRRFSVDNLSPEGIRGFSGSV